MSIDFSDIVKFKEDREKLNKSVLDFADINIKRFFSLDSAVYNESEAIPAKYKEMLGLVASLVLRCDDCVSYHLDKCFQSKVTDSEIREVLSIGLVVGGSITIPHLRRAVKTWNELKHL